MPITDKERWKEYEDKNKDPYGGCCVKVARRVMEILDGDGTPLTHDKIHDIVCRADKDVKAGGITGFMAGCVARMVSECHSRGEEFREAWNAKYKHTGEGVVTPPS